MPRPYDYDLRKRVIGLIKEGNPRKYVSKLLKVSIPTIDRWISLYKETGDVKVREEQKKGRKRIITDYNKFAKFIEEHKLLSLYEMSEKYSDNVCFMTIYRNLKKLGYSYKKNSGYTLKETKKQERHITRK